MFSVGVWQCEKAGKEKLAVAVCSPYLYVVCCAQAFMWWWVDFKLLQQYDSQHRRDRQHGCCRKSGMLSIKCPPLPVCGMAKRRKLCCDIVNSFPVYMVAFSSVVCVAVWCVVVCGSHP